MLVGSSTSHKLQLITSAAGDIEVAGSIIPTDVSSPPVVQGSGLVPLLPASITTAATTDLVTGAASTIKRVMELSVRNNHASVNNDVTVQRTDGTNTDTVIKCTLLPGELLLWTGFEWRHYDSNAAIYGAVSPQQFPSLLMNPGFATANLTSTKTLTSGTGFAAYVGKATKAVTSGVVRLRVTTAAATITWAEVAIAKGTINPGGNPTLTVVGYADVSAVINSTGQKTITVNVSAGQVINPGDDLWIVIGNAATTAGVVRAASIADDVQVGQQASLATRPSTIVGTPSAYTIEGATTLAAWAALII